MSWVDERAFIERQLKSFHTFFDELSLFRDSVDRIHSKMNFITHPAVTVAYCTNFRDVFWHFAKAQSNANESTKTHAQYLMMLEHLNRAVVDLLVDTLQKLQHIHRLISYSSNNTYNENIPPQERNRVEKRLLIAKNGYLHARKALLMLRNKRNSLYNLIASKNEFDTPVDYNNNTMYYKEVISILCQSFDFLLQLKSK